MPSSKGLQPPLGELPDVQQFTHSKKVSDYFPTKAPFLIQTLSSNDFFAKKQVL